MCTVLDLYFCEPKSIYITVDAMINPKFMILVLQNNLSTIYILLKRHVLMRRMKYQVLVRHGLPCKRHKLMFSVISFNCTHSQV